MARQMPALTPHQRQKMVKSHACMDRQGSSTLGLMLRQQAGLLSAEQPVVLQAAHSRRVHTALGEHSEVEAQLNSVVELMLDITESSVAFCWELGSGATHADLRVVSYTNTATIAVWSIDT